MNAISNLECNELTLHSPLELLFAQYKQDKQGIESISGFVENAKQMHYFFEACNVSNRPASASAVEVFQLEPALKALNATYWQRAMALTDVLEYMPAEKRNEWDEHICKHKTPEFEKDSVTATLVQMLNNRARFMAERVDGLFRALSGEHVTNQPQAFGKRFIMSYMLSYGHINWSRANYIHDLRCVIGKFLGREVPTSANTHRDLDNIDHDGKWNEFDGGAFKIRLYMKGTAHMEVHPDLAWQLNKVLAFLHPMAIPPEFRTKPKSKEKEHQLHTDLVSYQVIKELEDGYPHNSYDARRSTKLTYEYKEPPSQPTIDVMERLGGVLESKGVWEFGYIVMPVIKELARTGRLPEQKSHQFYPTPRELAEIAVDMAQIEPHHICLEPSAGQGGLADLMPKESTTCVEFSMLHCKILEAKGFKTVCNDFLPWAAGRAEAGWKFDRIVMNPPFSEGRALAHVKHAAQLLADNGILVAIMPASNKGKTIVEGMMHEWSSVYENEFKDASVNVVILKLTK